MANDFCSRISVRGRVAEVGFEGFLDLYLSRLGLELLSIYFDDGLMTVLVRGDESLVDMLSMACWLGPGRARVDDVLVNLIEAPFEGDA